MLKLKIPFSGTGPFDFTLKKGNRRVPESDRVKVIPYDDYVIVQIKGKLFVSVKSSIFFMKCVVISSNKALFTYNFFSPLFETSPILFSIVPMNKR